jgi:hypothetical protein
MGILGGGGTSGVKQAKPPVYTCLQIQTSAQGLPIPIIWGAQRLSGNCIDYLNFNVNTSGKGSGGKGGKGNNDTYSAAVMLAICEGATAGSTVSLGRMWSGVSETTLDGFGGGLFLGTSSQEPWEYAVADGHSVSYAYTCYYANSDLQLGSSASLPNINFEIFSTFNGYHVDNANTGLPDANFGDIIPDFLTNTRWGVNLDPALLVNFNEGALAGTGTLLVYNLAAGIYVSPLLKDAEQVSTTLQRWANVGNFWIFWNGTQIKCVPLGDTPISAHGVNYVPNLTPVYDLGPDDFVVMEKNGKQADPPIKVTRKDPADCFNQVQLNASIRTTNGGVANSPAYQDTPFRWQDVASIDKVGVQAPNTLSSAEICNTTTAAVVVSLIGQRAQYIRNTYEFKLLYYFLLLEPGDIVTLTDPNIGLSKTSVRIKQVDEDDKGVLAFVAEEFAYGVGTANIQEFEPAAAMAPFNQLTLPPSVNTPAFVQPDLSLTGGVPEVWIAASGGANFGGCGVFVSFDGVTYTQIGEIAASSLQGTLTAALPLATGLDTTHTLAIDLTESLGVIPATATEADAQAYRTLCLVDDELLAYGSVDPASDYTASLTFLERGLYGTTPAAHAAGAAFSRIDPSKIFSYTLPPAYIGQTLYFEFPTVNSFGAQAQTLDLCTPYTFTPGNLLTPIDLDVSFAFPASSGAEVSWSYAANQTPAEVNVRWSQSPASVSGRTYGTATFAAPATSGVIPADTDSGTVPLPFYISIQASQNGVTSPWSADLDVLPPSITSATNIYNSDGSYAGMQIVWPAAVAPGQPSGYVVLVTAGSDTVTYSASGGGSTGVFVPAAALQACLPNFGVGAAFTFSVQLQAYYGASNTLFGTAYSGATTPPLPALVPSMTAATDSDAGAGLIDVTWTRPPGTPTPTYFLISALHGSSSASNLAQVFGPFAALSNSATIGSTAPIPGGGSTSLVSGDSYTVWVSAYNANGTRMTFDSHGNPTGTPSATATAS